MKGYFMAKNSFVAEVTFKGAVIKILEILEILESTYILKKSKTIYRKIDQLKKLTIKYKNRYSQIANIATDDQSHR